ncbi:MAG: peptide chain release factor N(5)-glutamine methyltransferase [Deltaproteobacteria bacterium]|nr:peptide chain release factor N(5)-glutamine methyltransferase [Deltaproteobacteria bacterium]
MKLAELLALCRREMARRRPPGDPAVEILVSAATGIPRSRLLLEGDREVGDVAGRLRGWMERLAAGEPLQYVLGAWDFFGREFLLSRETLIPRPETEGLVEAVLDSLRRTGRKDPLALDVGTGCGAIAVTLAAEMPFLRAVAVDLSAGALRVARGNARRLGVADRVFFACGDGYCALKSGGRFDVVVSNPPYVSEGEWPFLPADVRDFEPAGALLAGPDGLSVLRRLVGEAAGYLRPDGDLWCEIGASQGEAVRRLPSPGLRFAGILPDLSGRDRVARWTRE